MKLQDAVAYKIKYSLKNQAPFNKPLPLEITGDQYFFPSPFVAKHP